MASRPLFRFALGALLVSALVSLAALAGTGLAEPEQAAAGATHKLPNPLYPELRAIAEREGFDAGFTREVWSERQGPTTDHPLFGLPEHSVDVLIFGDSTAAWGIVPPVVEAVSGLRVAMYAEEGMPLSVAQSGFYRTLIERYLAPEGRTLFYFATKNLLREPETPYSREWSGERLAQALARTGGGLGLSFERYWQWRSETLSGPLGAAGLRLPRLTPYASWLEPWLNPGWSALKREQTSKQASGFLRWDGWNATKYGPARKVTLRNTREPNRLQRWLPKPDRRGRAERNAQAALSLPGQKVFVVPWMTKPDFYLRSRAVYRQYYSEGADIIDLGKLHPEQGNYPMADDLHMKNQTGFEASVVLGKWLRQHPIAQRNP